MDINKVQNQDVLGTFVNKDASGILGYSNQIYDTEAGKSIKERITDMENNTISKETIEQSAKVMDSDNQSEQT